MYYTSVGMIEGVYKNHTAKNKGVTLPNAKKNVIRSLCNMLRAEFCDSSQWIKWKNLPTYEQDILLNKVSERLVWLDITNTHTELTKMTTQQFVNVIEMAVA